MTDHRARLERLVAARNRRRAARASAAWVALGVNDISRVFGVPRYMVYRPRVEDGEMRGVSIHACWVDETLHMEDR